ncbi:Lipoprotein [Mesobacillus thioparans]
MIIGSIIVSGCASSNNEQSNEGHSDSHSSPTQPSLKYELGSNNWSSVTSLTNDPNILEAYQFAVEHPEVLNYMPCYCGCYEEDGHTSNTNCFVDSVKGDVANLDTMGFG